MAANIVCVEVRSARNGDHEAHAAGRLHA